MTHHRLTLLVLPGSFAICRLAPSVPVPAWAESGDFFSVTRSADELSIVCQEEGVPEGTQCDKGWRCLRVAGTFEFSVVGILASLVAPLAEAGISVFTISTFDTDYLLVKDLELATGVLESAGHEIQKSAS